MNDHSEREWPRFEVLIEIIFQFSPELIKPILGAFNDVGIASTQLYLANLDRRCIWLTTNFDNQIEKALYKQNKAYKVIRNRSEINRELRNNVQKDIIIKLHGDSYSNFEDIINGTTIDRILQPISLKVVNKIVEHVGHSDIIFIGYSARDPDLLPLVRRLIPSAKSCTWIGKDKLLESEKEITKNTSSKHFRNGSPDALFNIFGLPIPYSITYDISWKSKIAHVIKSLSPEKIIQILAEIALFRNDRYSIDVITRLHEKDTKDSDVKRTIWNLERNLKASVLNNDIDPAPVLVKLRHHLKKSSDPALKSYIISAISEYSRKTNNSEDIIALYSDALKDERITIISKIDLLIAKASVQTFLGGKSLEPSIIELKKASSLAKDAGLWLKRTEADLRLGIALMRASRAEEAIPILNRCSRTYYETGSFRDISVVNFNLAEAHRINGEYNVAHDILEKILSLPDIEFDAELKAHSTANYALCLIHLGETNEARNLLTKIVHEGTSTVFKEILSNATYNIGWLEVITGNHKDSLHWLEQAYSRYKLQYNNKDRAGGSLALLSWSYFFLNNKVKAKSIFEKISSEDIVPQGNMRSDYDLIEYFLNEHNLAKHDLATIYERFCENPEQRFQIYLYMLKNKLGQRIDLLREVKKASVQSGMPFMLDTMNKYI